MLESEFQNKLIQELKKMFKGCIVTKLDSSHIQGIPDLLILYNNKWATLECKKSVRAKKQPNQEYYVGRMNEMSFSRFICPENKEEVLHDLQQAFLAQVNITGLTMTNPKLQNRIQNSLQLKKEQSFTILRQNVSHLDRNFRSPRKH